MLDEFGHTDGSPGVELLWRFGYPYTGHDTVIRPNV